MPVQAQAEIGLPLSPEQQAVLLDGERTLLLLAEITGPVDETRLRSAIEQVAAMHDALRCALVRTARHGGLRQRCLPELPPLSFQHIDLRVLGDDSHWRARFMAEPLAIEHGQLLRAALVRSHDARAILALAVSVVAADRGSLQALFTQIAALYVEGRAPHPDALFQYSQFTEWRQELAGGEEVEQGQSYWTEYLHCGEVLLPPRLSYRTHATHPRVACSQQRRAIDAEFAARIAATAADLGISLEFLLQANWWLLLARLTGFSHFVGGWQHDCRRNYQLMQGAVGVFDKILPVIVAARAEDTFAAWVARMGAVAEAHADAQEYWQVAAPPAAAHLAVGFAMGEVVHAAGGWQVSELPVLAPCFELALYVALDADGGQLLIQADAQCYSDCAMQRLLQQYVALLQSVVETPGARLADLSLLCSEERAALLVDRQRADFGTRTVAEHVLRWAQATPDAPAIEAAGQQLSYRQFAAEANRVAQWLQSQGVTRGELVALNLARSPQWLIAMLAVWQLGAGYVPLEPEWPVARRRTVLSDATPVLVLHADLSSIIADVPCRQVALSTMDTGEVAVTSVGCVPTLDDVAYVLYTSGSTGQPKGAVIEHGALLNYVAAASAALDLGRSRRWALISSMAADLGNTALFGALFNGGCLVIAGPDDTKDAPAFTRFMATHAVEGLKIVPSHLEALLECATPRLPRTLVLGGEAASRALIQRIAQLAPDCAVYNHYGPTETTVGIMVHALASNAVRGEVLPLSQVLANNRVRVLDAELRLVPSGMLGEVYIGGAQLCRGYLQRQVPGAFIDDPFRPGERLYRSGDLAYVRPEGGIQLAGRADHQVKVRGFRVELGEIEAALLACAGIRQAAVLAAHSKESGVELAAFVVSEAEASQWQQRLAAELATRLPAYMLPAHYVVLTEFPRLANGKVDRLALAALPAVKVRSRVATPPRTALEATLATCMAELLSCEAVGVDDNFFELGGHSLLAIKLAARIGRLLQIEVEPGLVLDCPSVAALAHRIELRAASDAGGEVQVVQLAQGSGVALYCFPGTLGNASEFATLAKALAGDHPVLGFVCHTLGPDRWNRQSITEIATACARFIAARAGDRGCALLGWSFGGDLAYETARQLVGITPVKFLGMVDVTDRHQLLEIEAVDAAISNEGTVDALPERVAHWLERSAMQSRWQQLLHDLDAIERAAVLNLLATYPQPLPEDGAAYDAKEYELWALLRCSWMKRRYFSEGVRPLDVPLHSWTAEETARSPRLCLRDWQACGEVRLNQQIAGTTHRSILEHSEFIGGVYQALHAGG